MIAISNKDLLKFSYIIIIKKKYFLNDLLVFKAPFSVEKSKVCTNFKFDLALIRITGLEFSIREFIIEHVVFLINSITLILNIKNSFI